MTSHRAMKALADELKAVRALASGLLQRGETDSQVVWTDWEIDFLESMAQRAGDAPLSTRQVEVLTELRDSAQRFASIEGFAVSGLIERCWQDRFELAAEDDLAFIESLKAAGLATVTRRQLGRLLRISRDLGVIERHHGIAA